MEALDLEALPGGNDHGHKRSDMEQAPGEVVRSGDSQRPREGNGDHHAMEMDEEEESSTPYESFERWRKEWVLMYGKGDDAFFYKPTEILPMPNTDGPVLPIHLRPVNTMEVYFVKVTHVAGSLRWPLDVYGHVAVRDSVDHRRNYLFHRDRNKCQTLASPQDSLLELTGPSRAIVLYDEPFFEIDLKVKGNGSSPSEDEVLCLHFFGYNNIAYHGKVSYAITEVVSSENCGMEFRFAHLRRSLEATLTAHVISGSRSFMARLTAGIPSIGDDDMVVLLDSRGKEVLVHEDGEVMLLRRVVVVEDWSDLILVLQAARLGADAEGTHVMKKRSYRVRSALRTEGFFTIGSTRLKILIAWSLVT